VVQKLGLVSGAGGERQDANKEKSKSHFVPSFYLSILLLLGQHHVEFRSVHIYGQSIHPWPSPVKSASRNLARSQSFLHVPQGINPFSSAIAFVPMFFVVHFHPSIERG
jgi:hypothetical protein